MKGKRILFVLLFIFIILISSTSVVFAYSSTAWLNLTYQNQAKSLWCWADCGSVIVNHNQPPTCSQYGFCYNTFGNYDNQGATLGDLVNFC